MQQKRSYFLHKKSHYLSLDQTAAEIAPVLHLITLFNPKCCTPLIPSLFSLFEQTGSRQTEGLLANVFFCLFLLCCKENTCGLTNFFWLLYLISHFTAILLVLTHLQVVFLIKMAITRLSCCPPSNINVGWHSSVGEVVVHKKSFYSLVLQCFH